jgi:hypothetical protein
MATRQLPELTESDKERFWKKVNKDGPVIRPELGRCWIWTAGAIKDGYGSFGIRDGVFLSHRIAWKIRFRQFDETLSVLHSCDNPGCVRWGHLFLGTMRDNMKDMARKKRHPWFVDRCRVVSGDKRLDGHLSGAAKLMSTDVLNIRRLSADGATQRDLAEQFGVTKSNVWCIIHRKSWTHI